MCIRRLSPWGVGVVLVPVVGALVVAWLVKNFAPEAKGHGVPEVMDAIYYNQGRIRPRVAVIKSLASAVSIGSGGSVGREGPIVQIGSAFGSTLGVADSDAHQRPGDAHRGRGGGRDCRDLQRTARRHRLRDRTAAGVHQRPHSAGGGDGDRGGDAYQPPAAGNRAVVLSSRPGGAGLPPDTSRSGWPRSSSWAA